MAFTLEEQSNSVPATSPVSGAPDRYFPSWLEIRQKIQRAILGLWTPAILALALVTTVAAYQFQPVHTLELGGGFDTPYLNLKEGGFGNPVQQPTEEAETTARSDAPTTNQKANAPEEIRDSYRWTRERPILLLPGIGTQSWQLSLRATGSPAIPAGQQVQVLLNGKPFSEFTLKPGAPVTQQLNFGAEWVSGGNLAVEMRVKPLGPVDYSVIQKYPGTFIPIDRLNDKTLYQGETGFKLYSARLQAAPGASGFVLPPLATLLSMLLAAWLLYLALAYAGVSGKWAFTSAAVVTFAGGLVLAIARLGLTIYTGRLVLLLALIVLFLPVLDITIPRILKSWQLPLPKWAWQALLVMFLVGMVGRGGGVMYPHMEVIDAPYHVRETLRVLENPAKQWFNKDLSKVPDQWESQAIIPYSTVTYFLQAPLAALPLDPYLSLNLLNISLDALKVFLIYALAVALGAGVRAAVVGAGLYLIIPSTWLLNSWGNWPTTMSLWLGFLCIVLVVALWQNLARPKVWLPLTLLLALTMMAYSVTAVFMGMLLYGWALGLFFITGRKEKLARQNGLVLAASCSLAAVIAIATYYFQFVPDIATTLTSFNSSLETKGSLGGFGNRTLTYYLGLYLGDVFFRYAAGSFIVIALVVWSWLVFGRRSKSGQLAVTATDAPNVASLRYSGWLWLAGSWFAVFMLFGLAQWKVDMVNKQVWFVLPLVVILAGVGLSWLWQRYKTPALMLATRTAISALVLWTFYGAMALWIYRVFIKRR